VKWLLVAALLAQALTMIVDEFYFHHKRGLKRWESFGHPLDTLTVAIVFGISAFFSFSTVPAWVFTVAAVFSCFFVTKDEFVHSQECQGAEQWLHAIMFSLHPVVFVALYSVWREGLETQFVASMSLNLIVQTQLIILFAFICYQLVYWKGGRRYAEQYTH